MLRYPGPLPRFLLGLPGILTALAVTAILWWSLPAMPRDSWKVPSPCHRVLIPKDSQTLATVHPTEIILWDPATGRKLHAVPVRRANHPAPMVDVYLAPDGQSLTWGEVQHDGHVVLKLWNTALPDGPVILPGARVVSAFADNGRTVVTDPPLTIWEAATGKVQRSLPTRPNLFGNSLVTATEDNQLLAVHWYKDGSISVQDLVTATERVIVPAGKQVPRNITLHAGLLSRDGRSLAAIDSGTLGLWDPKTGRQRTVLPWPAALQPLQFSSDGNLLVTKLDSTDEGAPSSQLAILWDVATIPPRERGSVHGWPTLSPDAKWLLVDVRFSLSQLHENWVLYDTATVQPHATIESADVFQLEFAPDSRTLAGLAFVSVPMASGKRLAEVRLWEVPSMRQLAVLGQGTVFTFFPDGRALAMPSEADGVLRLWDIPPRRPWWIEYVCRSSSRRWHCLRSGRCGAEHHNGLHAESVRRN
jgi:WD40 repeat protein